jgi:endonuclease/exonuclease/phosphatase family metal-dependent hydrolase
MLQLLLASVLFLFAEFSPAAEPLRVMTFNVRYPAKSDGSNQWEFRRDLLVDTIKDKDPDVFGTQELFYDQAEYIAAKLPEYAWFGLSRRGNRDDEHMGVFYKKSGLRLVSSGNFWLSETPDVPGSMSWDVTLPRMVTWGLFERSGSGERFYLYNTHFPHRTEDAAARVRCAQVIVDRIRQLPENVPLILTGDFNAPAGGDVHSRLTAVLQDAWINAQGRRGPDHTFNGFGKLNAGPRIDWILYRGPLAPSEAETVTRNDRGRHPSDHYPVFVVFGVGPQQRQSKQ